MLNRIISNLVLGFFVVVLVVVYGVAKQVPNYQAKTLEQQTAEKDASNADMQVAAETAGKAQIVLPDGKVVTAQVADTEEKRTQGLSGTSELADGEGMLFKFDAPGSYGIWMKDMNYDLDIIWMDADGQVVKVVQDAKMPAPGTDASGLLVYKNTSPALYVLELPAGSAAKEEITSGVKLTIS